MPSQKLGVDKPHSANAFASVSQAVPRHTAATIPAGIPISSAITNAINASCSVTGSFCAINARTGSCIRTDSPRSPRNTAPTQCA